MDRTIIDAYRAEEKELSETMHKKLEALMLVFHATSEFRKIFVEGMFLKPNPKAFFHVMHYLLTIFDINEFRKRFYWPIVDKKSEGSFKTTIVEYLTYLNKKHKMQWKYQWNYLVQMPGGNKFLTFLIEFTDFVTNEVVKQKEKYLDDKHCRLNASFSKSLLDKLKLRHKCFKVNTLHYVESLESGIKKYKENIEIIKDQLNFISQKSGVPLENFFDENFVDAFYKSSVSVFQEKFSNQVDNISKSGKNLKIMLKTMENFELEKRNFECNRDNFDNIPKQHFSDLEIITQNKINIEALFDIFLKIHPAIGDLLLAHDNNSLKMLNAEHFELTKFHTEALKLDNDTKCFISSINKNIDELKGLLEEVPILEEDELQIQSNLLQKLMSTPPIINCNANDSLFGRRLPLMQSALATTSGNEFSFANNQTTVLFPKSARKMKDVNKTQNPSNSKMVDAPSFLLSLKKQKKSNSNLVNKLENQSLSQLAKKWKEQEAHLYDTTSEIDTDLKLENKENKKNEIENDLSEILIDKTVKFIENSCTVEKFELSKRKLFLDVPQKLQKVLKGSPSFLKQDSPLNLEKISTSPSGKLDPLIKISKNDIAIQLSSYSPMAKLDNSAKIITEEIVDTSLLINLSDVKETIFNVSDSILMNIPM